MINDFKSLFYKSSIVIKNNLVIGLSGGPDSVFLLYYINYLREHFGFLGSVIPIIKWPCKNFPLNSTAKAFVENKIATKSNNFFIT